MSVNPLLPRYADATTRPPRSVPRQARDLRRQELAPAALQKKLIATPYRAPKPLSPATVEQHRIRTSNAIPEADRLIILFALLTGLRQGEQFNLDLADLRLDADAPHVVVRFG